MSLSAIYSAIESMAVAVDSVTATVYGLANMPDSIETAHLPMRAIVSIGGNTQGQSMRLATFGSPPGAELMWAVQDLMLYKPVGQGAGLKEHNAVLIAYVDSYLTALRNSAQMTSVSLVTDARLEPGIYEHPPGSGAQFLGVMVTLTIQEIV